MARRSMCFFHRFGSSTPRRTGLLDARGEQSKQRLFVRRLRHQRPRRSELGDPDTTRWKVHPPQEQPRGGVRNACSMPQFGAKVMACSGGGAEKAWGNAGGKMSSHPSGEASGH